MNKKSKTKKERVRILAVKMLKINQIKMIIKCSEFGILISRLRNLSRKSWMIVLILVKKMTLNWNQIQYQIIIFPANLS